MREQLLAPELVDDRVVAQAFRRGAQAKRRWQWARRQSNRLGELTRDFRQASEPLTQGVLEREHLLRVASGTRLSAQLSEEKRIARDLRIGVNQKGRLCTRQPTTGERYRVLAREPL